VVRIYKINEIWTRLKDANWERIVAEAMNERLDQGGEEVVDDDYFQDGIENKDRNMLEVKASECKIWGWVSGGAWKSLLLC